MRTPADTFWRPLHPCQPQGTLLWFPLTALGKDGKQAYLPSYGGLQLNMMGAIDSLDPMGPFYTPLRSTVSNQYQQTILSIFQTLMNYESDKRIHF